MRAIRVNRFGGPEVLEWTELADPVAGPGQAVVRVAAADVLLVEAKVRSGWGQEYFPVEFPYIPGGAVAGEVIAVGAGVDDGWVGRRVAARTGGDGGYAERVAVPVESLVPVPDGLDLTDAAALQHDGPTALALFANAAVGPDDAVLIVAAAGGMGTLLVRLARAAGARVIGAARGERKLELVRSLGATAVDYDRPDWVERVREAAGGAGVDVVFDGVGGKVGTDAFAATADGARFSAHGAAAGSFAAVEAEEATRRGVTVRGIEQAQLPPEEGVRLTERALAEAAAGRMTPVIGQVFALERAVDAHAAIAERNVIGKTLLVA